jgi:mRNA-degrading endonuclease toxin of MazEF toxin-antitoxin module
MRFELASTLIHSACRVVSSRAHRPHQKPASQLGREQKSGHLLEQVTADCSPPAYPTTLKGQIMQTVNTISITNQNQNCQVPYSNPEDDLWQVIAVMQLEPGDVCRAPIPFTDGSAQKVRPAIVLASQGTNLVVVPLTTHAPRDEFDVPLLPSAASGLHKQGTARCSQLLSISKSVVIEVLGRALPADRQRVVETTARWFKTIVASAQPIEV